MLAELLTRRRAGCPDLKRVFDAHKDRVFTVALVCLNGDQAAAEDAAQEVFVRLSGSFAARQSSPPGCTA
ncbi:hypothetical protein [Armatimonas sp.]|uniref:hypothetical protein n=1 Tax=Armatimonas sp. TaxID=1872638 RepID=UPI0037538CE0